MMASALISPRVRNTFLEFRDEPSPCSSTKRKAASMPVLRLKLKDQVARLSGSELARLSSSDIDRTGSPKMTTMRVSNLPQRCKQDRFIALLDSYGFEGTYDFVYVPYCTEKRKNKGYGFVNFLDAENGKRLYKLWNLQQVFPAVHSSQSIKALTVGYGAIQGAEENVRALQEKNNPPEFYSAVQPARITSFSSAGALTRIPDSWRATAVTRHSRQSLQSEFDHSRQSEFALPKETSSLV